MKINKVCLLGGTGFVGRHVVHRLSSQGVACRVLTRHPHRHRALTIDTGCELVSTDVFDEAALATQLQDCDAAINLVGILNESGRQGFRRVHVELVETLLGACRRSGIRRLLHMSALHADADKGGSRYLRSKGEGEDLAHTRGQPDIAVTSFRPSVIFGHDDSFINRFATLLRLPGPMPLACPDARFAPVYVGDVAQAFVHSLEARATFGRRYELCGPQVYRLEEIVRYVAQQLGRRKLVLRLPDAAARLQAKVLERVPGRPFTTDNYLSLQTPSVCNEDGLGQLGITATHMDTVVPQFLRNDTPRGRLRGLRQHR